MVLLFYGPKALAKKCVGLERGQIGPPPFFFSFAKMPASYQVYRYEDRVLVAVAIEENRKIRQIWPCAKDKPFLFDTHQEWLQELPNLVVIVQKGISTVRSGDENVDSNGNLLLDEYEEDPDFEPSKVNYD